VEIVSSKLIIMIDTDAVQQSVSMHSCSCARVRLHVCTYVCARGPLVNLFLQSISLGLGQLIHCPCLTGNMMQGLGFRV
jgi:hypothetical protein